MADRHTTEKLLEGERLSGKVTLFATSFRIMSITERQKRTTSYPARECIRIMTRPIRYRLA